eukprot:15065318-Ditylum_brightwellii.AAC.1
MHSPKGIALELVLEGYVLDKAWGHKDWFCQGLNCSHDVLRDQLAIHDQCQRCDLSIWESSLKRFTYQHRFTKILLDKCKAGLAHMPGCEWLLICCQCTDIIIDASAMDFTFTAFSLVIFDLALPNRDYD